MRRDLSDKELIIFDLDGTLALSKLPVDKEMTKLILRLLRFRKVAVIGGGKYELFRFQLLNRLTHPPNLLKNLSVFPTNAAQFYRYTNGWKRIYVHNLKNIDKTKIKKALREALDKAGYKKPGHIYGPVIEDRGSQITFSALGQKAPLGLKIKWNKKKDLRPKLVKFLTRSLKSFEVRQGGLTSIDILGKGVDKAYGIRQMERQLKIPKKKMLFIGDAIFPGGNDYPVLKAGVKSINVSGPKETKKIITKLLKNQ